MILKENEGVAGFVSMLRRRDIILWSKHGELRYKAPKGVLTDDDLVTLRQLRIQVVALLEREATVVGQGVSSANCRAPLSFTQLAHWNTYHLDDRTGIRQIASATRVLGRLDTAAFSSGIDCVIQRHAALRTRIVVVDGVPLQEVSDSGYGELELVDLAAFSAVARDIEVSRLIERAILEPVDVGGGALLSMRLLKLADREQVLIVAMEHMISDMISMDIFLRELFSVYMQIASGRSCSLPEVPASFPMYALRQRDGESSLLEKLKPYWTEHLMRCGRVRFPNQSDVQTADRPGWGTVPIRIGRDLRADLQRWSRIRKTTLAMSVFTAYVALVLRLCRVSQCLIQYQCDGRADSTLANAIGFFAMPLYLSVHIAEDDNFIDLLGKVTEEYCRAYENADFGYLSAQMPRPGFTCNTVFNWVPEARRCSPSSEETSANVAFSPIRFAHPISRVLEIDAEPYVFLVDEGEKVVGDLYFPNNRFSPQHMVRLGWSFIEMLGALLKQPTGCVNAVPLKQVEQLVGTVKVS